MRASGTTTYCILIQTSSTIMLYDGGAHIDEGMYSLNTFPIPVHIP